MTTNLGNNALERKKVSISQKRQFTIPTKFYNTLGFNTEAECILRGNELIIRPINNKNNGEFAEEILEELISKGLSGEKLLTEFKKEQSKVKSAIDSMLSDAEEAAKGKTDYMTFEDIFKSKE